jgi:hypothetical protein
MDCPCEFQGGVELPLFITPGTTFNELSFVVEDDEGVAQPLPGYGGTFQVFEAEDADFISPIISASEADFLTVNTPTGAVILDLPPAETSKLKKYSAYKYRLRLTVGSDIFPYLYGAVNVSEG